MFRPRVRAAGTHTLQKPVPPVPPVPRPVNIGFFEGPDPYQRCTGPVPKHRNNASQLEARLTSGIPQFCFLHSLASAMGPTGRLRDEVEGEGYELALVYLRRETRQPHSESVK